MARYILRLIGTTDYLKRAYGNTEGFQLTKKSNQAKVFCDSQLEDARVDIANAMRLEYNSKVEVIRVL